MKAKILMLALLFFFLKSLSAQTVHLFLSEISGTVGDTVTVDLRVKNFTDISAMQLTVDWETSALQFISVHSFGEQSMLETDFQANDVEGYLSMLWYEPDLMAISLADSSVVFSMDFEIKDQESGAVPISITNTPTDIIIANGSFEEVPFVIQGGEVVVSAKSLLEEIGFSIFPNPAGSELKMFVDNKQVDLKEIQLLSSTGKLLKRISGESASLDVSDFSPGIYLIRVQSNSGKSLTRLWIKQ